VWNALVNANLIGPRCGLALFLLGGIVSATPSRTFAQSTLKKTPSASASPTSHAPAKNIWIAPHTKWGDPDIEGVWEGFETVPLERPLQLGDKKFYTDAEIADKEAKAKEKAKEKQALVAQGKIEHEGFRAVPNYNAIFEYSDKPPDPHISKYTSAIIDPPTGRLPAWTLDQVKFWEAREAATKGHGETDSPDDMNLNARCIAAVSEAEVTNWGMSFGGAAATSPGRPEPGFGEDVELGDGFGTNASAGPVRQILQSPGYVAFVLGDKPEYRIVPLNNHPHPGSKIRKWMGDARGHWDGKSLVVDITNITFGSMVIPNYGGAMYPGSGETLHVIERFTRRDANTLEYRYTIDDPEVYVQPYTVLHVLRKNDAYQAVTNICQEDPKDLANSLANARADEADSEQGGEDSIEERAPRLAQLKQQAIAAAKNAKQNSSSK
jgi:hypothetical protein